MNDDKLVSLNFYERQDLMVLLADENKYLDKNVETLGEKYVSERKEINDRTIKKLS